jgi:hypothetical protein
MAFSESDEDVEEDAFEEADFGGEGFSERMDILLNGLRVRRTGPLLSTLLGGTSLVFFGSVKAQFSHGIALFLSFSSYVLLKLESRLWLFDVPCNAATLGLSGGVSIVGIGTLSGSALSDDVELVLLTPLRIASPAFSERELVLWRLVAGSSSP